MSKIYFIQTAPEAGDCTAPYDVHFCQPMTVREFIDEILTRNEWGTVYIYDPNNPENLCRRKECCEYKYDKLKSLFPDYIQERTIESASAHGGWTMMDYILMLK